MKTLYVMCGIPASGKSTLSKKIASDYGITRFSLDEMGYIRQHRIIPYIIDALENGDSVVADSLYTIKEWRKELLEAVKEIECKRILVYMDIPLNVCIQRNRNRDNPLPDYCIENEFEHFENPSLDEGWDKIIHVKEYITHERIYEDNIECCNGMGTW